MSTIYNYSGQFDTLAPAGLGVVTFNLQLTASSASLPTLITSITGTLSYTGTSPTLTTNPSTASLLPTGTYLGNDNILTDITASPYFTSNGIAFQDNNNGNIMYNVHLFNSGAPRDFVTNSATNIQHPFITESISLACLLPLSSILTPSGYRCLKDINVGDEVVTADERVVKVKKCVNIELPFTTEEKYFPMKIEKGMFFALNDIYISRDHAFKIFNEKWITPRELDLYVCTENDLKQLGYDKIIYKHIELESENGETRRDNTIIVEGITMESYSTESI
jgi:hypothetical protein